MLGLYPAVGGLARGYEYLLRVIVMQHLVVLLIHFFILSIHKYLTANYICASKCCSFIEIQFCNIRVKGVWGPGVSSVSTHPDIIICNIQQRIFV